MTVRISDMPNQQKALVLPAKQGLFEIQSVPIPTPPPGQLLIKVHSTALNPVDWKIQVHGLYVEEYPTVLGVDIAGTVEALGEDVDNFSKGDRVYVMVASRVADVVALTAQQLHGRHLQVLASWIPAIHNFQR